MKRASYVVEEKSHFGRDFPFIVCVCSTAALCSAKAQQKKAKIVRLQNRYNRRWNLMQLNQGTFFFL
jgi:hypothetical protein